MTFAQRVPRDGKVFLSRPPQPVYSPLSTRAREGLGRLRIATTHSMAGTFVAESAKSFADRLVAA
jgi:hypothetical protein